MPPVRGRQLWPDPAHDSADPRNGKAESSTQYVPKYSFDLKPPPKPSSKRSAATGHSRRRSHIVPAAPVPQMEQFSTGWVQKETQIDDSLTHEFEGELMDEGTYEIRTKGESFDDFPECYPDEAIDSDYHDSEELLGMDFLAEERPNSSERVQISKEKCARLERAQQNIPRFIFRVYSKLSGRILQEDEPEPKWSPPEDMVLNSRDGIIPLAHHPYNSTGRQRIENVPSKALVRMIRSHLNWEDSFSKTYPHTHFSSWSPSLGFCLGYAASLHTKDHEDISLCIVDTTLLDGAAKVYRTRDLAKIFDMSFSCPHEYLAYNVVAGSALKVVPYDSFRDDLFRGGHWAPFTQEEGELFSWLMESAQKVLFEKATVRHIHPEEVVSMLLVAEEMVNASSSTVVDKKAIIVIVVSLLALRRRQWCGRKVTKMSLTFLLRGFQLRYGPDQWDEWREAFVQLGAEKWVADNRILEPKYLPELGHMVVLLRAAASEYAKE